MKTHQLFGKKIAILGFGREGKSTLAWLLKQGVQQKDITLLDKKEIDPLVLESLGCSQIHRVTGSRYVHNMEKYDLIFRTPGLTTHLIEEDGVRVSAEVQGKLISQTQIFCDNFDGILIGVTGTKGKTTTSTFLYEMLKRAGKSVVLAGNVGKPVLDQIDFDTPPEIVVYEVSSFMLESLDDFHCAIGILTTLMPVHIREHGSYEKYVAAKCKLLSHSEYALIGNQASEELNTLNIHGALTENIQKNIHSSTTYGQHGTYIFEDGYFKLSKPTLTDTSVDTVIGSDKEMKLLGLHNRYNLCAALGVCDRLGISCEVFFETLAEFQAIEHRLEFVGEYGGVKRYNDAIATSPLATEAAIAAFKEDLDTIFLGGVEGVYDFSGVKLLLEKYQVRNVVLFPDTGARIRKLLEGSMQYNFLETRSMEEAVQWAARVTEKGKVALLSCGSPSFSVWSGFEEKGRLFKEAVKAVA